MNGREKEARRLIGFKELLLKEESTLLLMARCSSMPGDVQINIRCKAVSGGSWQQTNSCQGKAEIFGVTENSKQLVIHKGKWQQKEHDRTSAIVVMNKCDSILAAQVAAGISSAPILDCSSGTSGQLAAFRKNPILGHACKNVSVCIKEKVELYPEKVHLSVWKEQDKRLDMSPSFAAADATPSSRVSHLYQSRGLGPIMGLPANNAVVLIPPVCLHRPDVSFFLVEMKVMAKKEEVVVRSSEVNECHHDCPLANWIRKSVTLQDNLEDDRYFQAQQ
ncbi:uncharacterized protein LOC125698021 [Lagopus muta]|uniref:uncharacterized protein LOC125698021 n=1 Tax=Lagopus muta TaxID=64668 RepID=UPI0020A12994|nr:uncharacterized protein LOC125698021 [Lagopus muta]